MSSEKDNLISPEVILEDAARISAKLVIGDRIENIDPEPFFGHFFTGLVKKVTLQAETLAVAYDQGLITLYINPNFWMEYLPTIKLKVGAIKHEILHIVLKHIFRGQDFSHKLLFNVAADLVVNQYIQADHLVKGAVLLSNFPDLDLEPNQHLNYYYDALANLQSKYASKEEEGDEEDSPSWKFLKSLMDQDNQVHKQHDFWKNIENLDSAEKDIAESMANQALESTLGRVKPHHYGNLPAGLQKYLKEFELSLQPVVNWKRLLHLFANSSRRTQIKNTIRRPSKRYGSNPGIKVKKKQKILVALDTSGSIQKQELTDFFNEIHYIWKQKVEIFIVECDINIHRKYYYSGIVPQVVRGGGGTAFDAPIEYANLIYRPDALVYFTDGYGPIPTSRSNCPVFWLISREGVKPENLEEFQGRIVKMN